MSSKSDKKSDVCTRCGASGFALIADNDYAKKLGRHCATCGLYEGVKDS